MDNEENNRKKEKEQLKSQTTSILVLSIAVLLFGLYDFIQSFIKLGEIEAIHRQTLLGKGLMAILMAGLIGYIAYNIARADNSAHSLSIMNFSDNKVAFGMDLGQALKDIFEKYKFRKLNFTVVVGNPIEKSYDKMIKKYGGRIVGTYKSDVKLIDGEYYDKKSYEILADEYFATIKSL